VCKSKQEIEILVVGASGRQCVCMYVVLGLRIANWEYECESKGESQKMRLHHTPAGRKAERQKGRQVDRQIDRPTGSRVQEYESVIHYWISQKVQYKVK
jgi:hypothetical protein